MRSTFLLLAWGAVSAAFDNTCNDADSQSLLQSRKKVHVHKRTATADDLLKSVREVANTFTADSSVTMTPEEVNAALGDANSALQTMIPGFAEQHNLAQQELDDAVRAVQACHDEHGGELMSRLELAVATRYSAKEDCDESLGDAMQAEAAACEGQGDNPNCACEEARAANADQRAVCDSVTATYEVAFCEHQLACDMFHGCHEREVDIYNDVRADAEAEMISRQQAYIAAVQAECIVELITRAMLTGTPIPDASLTACDDVSVDDLALNFPTVPADPAECPAPRSDDPQCDAGAAPLTCNWVLPSAWSITASSSWDGNYGPDNVKVHGGRPWHSGRDNSFPDHLIFDAGEAVTLSGFATAHPGGWGGSAMRDYTFSSSDDGSTFSEVVSGTGTNLGHGQRQEIEFSPVSARYWKLHMTSNYGYHRLLTAQYVEFRAQSSCLTGSHLRYANPDHAANGLCVSMSTARGAGCDSDGNCVGHGNSDATLQNCDDSDAGQLWTYSGNQLHSSLFPNACLTVGSSRNHGACEPFTLQECSASNTRQQFNTEDVAGTTVWRNTATNLAIDSDSWRNTVNNWIWACPGTNTAKYFNLQ